MTSDSEEFLLRQRTNYSSTLASDGLVRAFLFLLLSSRLLVRVIAVRPGLQFGDDLVAFQAWVQHGAIWRKDRRINPGILCQALAQAVCSLPVVGSPAL